MENCPNRFQDMNELREFIESLRGSMSDSDFDLILYVSGLLDNQAVSDEIILQNQLVKIDHHLVPMMIDINQRGIITLASCSGLQEEHQNSKFRPQTGYVAINFDSNLFDFLQRNIKDSIIEVQESTCYFMPSISIYIHSNNDSILKEKWQLVWDTLKQWQDLSNQKEEK